MPEGCLRIGSALHNIVGDNVLPGTPIMFNLTAVQEAIKNQGIDGWLLYDFRGLNVLARRVLGIVAEAILSRRWFYYIPARGQPRKLLHQIEPHSLDHLPGRNELYLRWQ